MRISMVVGSVSREAGGIFFALQRLAQSLQSLGAELQVVGLRDKHTFEDLSSWSPICPTVIKQFGPAKFGLALGLEREIRSYRPDVVHVHGLWSAMSLPISRLSSRGMPTKISPHGMLDPWALKNSRTKKSIAWQFWEKRNLDRATCLHALNASEAEAARALLPEASIATIPNGIDIPENEIVRKPIAGQENPRLLFVSRIHPKKGLMAFLEHWAAIRTRLAKPWVLRIAGPDEVGHLAELKIRASSLGLNDCVEFIGPIYGENKAQELEKASAFVLPSYSEGLPMAVLEAWAVGLPSFITRECNLPEAFDAGAAVRITDDPELLLTGLNNPNLEAIGARARKLAEERFGWSSIAARHLEVYEWMISKRDNPPLPADISLA